MADINNFSNMKCNTITLYLYMPCFQPIFSSPILFNEVGCVGYAEVNLDCTNYFKISNLYFKFYFGGTWVAQSVKRPTSAQICSRGSWVRAPESRFVLTAQNLEPILDSASPSLLAPPPLMLCLSLSLSPSKINKILKITFYFVILTFEYK